MAVTIRAEVSFDQEAVRRVHCEAFPSAAEADLVDALRANGNLLTSLVAVDDTEVVGHVAFSPVSLSEGALVGAGLAPVAVRPTHQRRGYAGQLIQVGLEECLQLGIDYVVVLGDPAYYQRFGFRPASAFGLENEYGAGDEFMVLELTADSLADLRGLVRYGEEFAVFS